MPEAIKVTSKEMLNIILANGGPKDCFIVLGEDGSARSSKVISMSPDGRYYCYAEIDDTEEEYETLQAMLEDSNIGLAIEKGCFYYEAA